MKLLLNQCYCEHEVKSLSRVWLCDPMDCRLSGSSAHGIFQARILEWVAISSSRAISWPRDRTWVSLIVGRCFTVWAIRDSLIVKIVCVLFILIIWFLQPCIMPELLISQSISHLIIIIIILPYFNKARAELTQMERQINENLLVATATILL